MDHVCKYYRWNNGALRCSVCNKPTRPAGPKLSPLLPEMKPEITETETDLKMTQKPEDKSVKKTQVKKAR